MELAFGDATLIAQNQSVADAVSRRNHTVQAAYLARFADVGGRLIQRGLDGQSHHVGSRDASVIRDFSNSLDGDTIDDSIERSFTGVEGDFIATVRKTVDRGVWPPTAPQRRAIAAWISLQFLRTPATRSFPGDLEDIAYRHSLGLTSAPELRRFLEDRSRPTTPVEAISLWEAYRAPRGAAVSGSVQAHQGLMHQFGESITNVVLDRGWTLLRSDEPRLFTTDQPIASLLRVASVAQSDGLSALGRLLVPLDRATCLVIEELEQPDQVRQIGFDEALVIAQDVAAHVRRYIWHHPSDDLVDQVYLPPADPRDGQSVKVWLAGLIGRTDRDRLID